MSKVVKLKLVNRSNNPNRQSFVIFQKNLAADFTELSVAWKVIQFLGVGNYHPFEYTYDLYISGSDSYGNYTYPMDAQSGLMYKMMTDPSGDQLVQSGAASNNNEIEILNALPQGAINANCFRSGRLLATKTAIAPGEKAVFQFDPTLIIGAVTQIQEGQIMNSAIVSNINTEISLLGIASADIVVSGGGIGTSATELKFTVDNVQFA